MAYESTMQDEDRAFIVGLSESEKQELQQMKEFELHQAHTKDIEGDLIQGVAKHTCILPLNGSYVGINGTLVWSPKVTLLFSASPLATSCADMPVLLLVLVLVSILVAISSAGGAPLRKHTVAHAAFTNPSLLLPPPVNPAGGSATARDVALEQFAKKKYRTGCTPSNPPRPETLPPLRPPLPSHTAQSYACNQLATDRSGTRSCKMKEQLPRCMRATGVASRGAGPIATCRLLAGRSLSEMVVSEVREETATRVCVVC